MPRIGRTAGFTLLEVLVVLFIIGVITAMATLSIGVATSRKGTEKEIERIGDLLALASEEAVLRGREFGLTFYQTEYAFSTYDEQTDRWVPLGSGVEPFVPHQFPPETVVDLMIENRLVKLAAEMPPQQADKKLKDDDKDADTMRHGLPRADDPNQPQVFLYSSGDIKPFRLHLRPAIGKPGITLQVAENGKIERIRDER